MTERQKEFTNILRLYNACQAIIGIVVFLMMTLYAILFGSFGLIENSEPEAALVFGGFFAVFFGGIALFYLIFTILHGLVAWKLDQPKKWVWITTIALTILQLFNIYFLPLNIYFLIQLFKEENRKFYNQ